MRKEYRLLCDESIVTNSGSEDVWAVNAALYGQEAHLKAFQRRFSTQVNPKTKWQRSWLQSDQFSDIQTGISEIFNALEKSHLKVIFSYVDGRHTGKDFEEKDPVAQGQYRIAKRAIKRISRISTDFHLNHEMDAGRHNVFNMQLDETVKLSRLASRRAKFHGGFAARYGKKHADLQAADFLAGAFAYFANGGASEDFVPVKGRSSTVAEERRGICVNMISQWNSAFGLNFNPDKPVETIRHNSGALRPRKLPSWDQIPPIEIIEIMPKSELAMRSFA